MKPLVCKSKKCFILVSIVLSIALAVTAHIAAFFIIFGNTEYETTNISDYGTFNKTLDNKTTQELLEFFPERIEPYFGSPNYIYRTERESGYTFEAWLEFTIEDETEFERFISNTVKGIKCQKFLYDTSYDEYVIADYLILDEHTNGEKAKKDYYQYEYADIRKILINTSEKKVIFIAVCVDVETGVDTSFLREYFSRFSIDALSYGPRVPSTWRIDKNSKLWTWENMKSWDGLREP